LLAPVSALIATILVPTTTFITTRLISATPFITSLITARFSALIAFLTILTRWLTHGFILTSRLTLLAMLYRIGTTALEVTVIDATCHRNTSNG
jgi:hypothetical protein